MQLRGLGERCKLLHQQGLGWIQPKSNLMHFSLKIWHLVAPIFHFPWLFPDYGPKYFHLTFPWPLKFPFSSFPWPVETLVQTCLHLSFSLLTTSCSRCWTFSKSLRSVLRNTRLSSHRSRPTSAPPVGSPSLAYDSSKSDATQPGHPSVRLVSQLSVTRSVNRSILDSHHTVPDQRQSKQLLNQAFSQSDIRSIGRSLSQWILDSSYSSRPTPAQPAGSPSPAYDSYQSVTYNSAWPSFCEVSWSVSQASQSITWSVNQSINIELSSHSSGLMSAWPLVSISLAYNSNWSITHLLTTQPGHPSVRSVSQSVNGSILLSSHSSSLACDSSQWISHSQLSLAIPP